MASLTTHDLDLSGFQNCLSPFRTELSGHKEDDTAHILQTPSRDPVANRLPSLHQLSV